MVCTTKVWDETFKNGKWYEDQAKFLLSPLQCMGEPFLQKKICMGEQTVLGKFMMECFTRGLMIRSCKGGSKWLRGLKSRVNFPLTDVTWVIDILFEKLTTQKGDWIWKIPSAHYACGVGISCKVCLLFLKKCWCLD